MTQTRTRTEALDSLERVIAGALATDPHVYDDPDAPRHAVEECDCVAVVTTWVAPAPVPRARPAWLPEITPERQAQIKALTVVLLKVLAVTVVALVVVAALLTLMVLLATLVALAWFVKWAAPSLARKRRR